MVKSEPGAASNVRHRASAKPKDQQQSRQAPESPACHSSMAWQVNTIPFKPTTPPAEADTSSSVLFKFIIAVAIHTL